MAMLYQHLGIDPQLVNCSKVKLLKAAERLVSCSVADILKQDGCGRLQNTG
jgi:hypothetical protein